MRNLARSLLAAFLAALATAVVLVVGPAAPAQAAPATCEYPVCVCPTLTVTTTTPLPGERFGVGGVGFVPGRTVTVLLKPVRDTNIKDVRTLKTVRTDAQGNFSTLVKLPDGATGTYDVTARGGVPAGTAGGKVCAADPSARLDVNGRETVLPANNDETTTAFTGFNLLWLLLLAAALVAIGVYVTRRGRQDEVVRSIHG